MENSANIESNIPNENPQKEFLKRRIIIEKNKTGEKIQALMEEQQKKNDKLLSKKEQLEKDNQNLLIEINDLKDKLDRLNPNNIEIKFKIQEGKVYPIFIDKSSTLSSAFSKFSTKIDNPQYSDIKKIIFLYHGENKTNLFIDNQPISSLKLKPDEPIIVTPYLLKFSYNNTK